MIKTGDSFHAKDRQGYKYEYMLLGIEPDSSKGGIVLYNKDADENTIVEIDWFGERKITKEERV